MRRLQVLGEWNHFDDVDIADDDVDVDIADDD